MQALCDAERTVAHFSVGGWFYGLTQGLGLKNVFLRQEQFRRADDEKFSLNLAREIVASTIKNQRTLLQRNHVGPPARAIEALKRLAKQTLDAGQLDMLLGLEGTAAHYYFANLSGMLKVEDETEQPVFDFTTRNRRPPRDPVNALLSLGYSMLARDLTITCHAVGFDPFIGFYHQPRFGRPALALDLMEGFRPLIVDSAVITAINTRMVTRDDFIQVGQSVALTPKGRKRFITAYEQRMDALVTHPLFGYRVNYRRVLEIQTRLLARVVTGELSRYPGPRRADPAGHQPQTRRLRISGGIWLLSSGWTSRRRAMSARSFCRLLRRRSGSEAAHTLPDMTSSIAATGSRSPRTSCSDARSAKGAYRGSSWIWIRRSLPAAETFRLCRNRSTVNCCSNSGSSRSRSDPAMTRSKSRLTTGSAYALTACPPMTQKRTC